MNPATPPSRQGTAPTAAPPPRRAADATAGDDAAPATTGAWQASVGAASNADLKLAMAASGTVLSVFTVGHMAGNMQVYLGRERYNRYALLLRHAGAPVLPANTLLWAARIGLLASTATHVAAGTDLTLRAWRAEGRTVAGTVRQVTRQVATVVDRRPRLALPGRPTGAPERSTGTAKVYRRAPFDGAFLPGRFEADAPRRRPRGRRRSVPQVIARSMRSTGAVLGLFVTYHVLDLTTGTRPAASRAFKHGDAYGNLVGSLSRPVVAVFYTTSMAALAGHMVHGLRTAALDTGLTTTARRVHRVDVAAKAVGAVVAVGNASIPLAVSFKVVR
ncbi:hypothetical protein NUV30_03290 [Kocuria rhizophila]|uniref:hypothetical protein n=1 Tax=Kocuria TaxID=57493 RepID=UPI0003829EE5|nr:hypothetical protein [Kocuria rhizophila]MCR4525407.1 hypothetical protein [Kocuria rhizophila]MCT1916108.1 hypothetical protein [Kocuria rhizophila]